VSKFTPRERQKSNRVLSQMDGEKRRRVRKLATTTASSRENPLATYLYTTPGPGSWTKSDFGTKVEIWACSGGSGGGSGRKGAAGSIRGGGNSGNTGGIPQYLGTFDISNFPSQIAFDIGTGGAGGASQTANNTNGNSGTPGGATQITLNGVTLTVPVQPAGSGGGTTLPASTSYSSRVDPSSVFRFTTNQFSGGSLNAANELVAPSETPSHIGTSIPLPGVDAVVDFNSSSPYPLFPLVGAPRGGEASLTGNGQKGGDGVLGLGGGGGGGATNDVGDSGAGGRGGDGFVYFIVY
jgi:hypothetical protein